MTFVQAPNRKPSMPQTAATRYLAALAERGIESLFVNAGTDFAPIVEAYAVNKADGGPTLPTPIRAKCCAAVAGSLRKRKAIQPAVNSCSVL